MNARRSIPILLVTATAAAAAFLFAPTTLRFDDDVAPVSANEAQDVGTATESTSGRRIELAPSVTSLYGAPAGSRFAYALEGATSYSMQSPNAERSAATEVRFVGKLRLDVVARRDREVLCAVLLEGLRLDVGHGVDVGSSKELAAHQDAARTPFVVRMSDAGTLLGYRFADKLDGQQRNFVRGIFGAFAFTVPQPLAKTWKAEEDDASGRFEARYSLLRDEGDRVAVRRQKTRYVTLSASLGQAAKHSVAGTAQAEFSREAAWLTSARVDERISLDTSVMELSVTMRMRATLRLLTSERAVETPRVAWDGDWRAAAGHAEDLGSNAAAEQERLRREMKNVRLIDVIAELRATAGSDQSYEQWRQLGKLLQARPELLEEVERMLVVGQINGDLAALTITAAGTTTHVAAQDFLMRARANAHLDPDLRSAATHAMFQIAVPSPALLAGLANDLERAPRWARTEQEALLALAALAPRAKQALADGRTGVDALLALEKRAARLDALPTWLDALGNAASPRVVAVAERFLDHSAARVREAAVSALRGVESAKALEVLLSATSDSDASVRTRAVEILARRNGSRVTTTLERIAASDSDESLRRLAKDLLSRRS